MAKKDVAAFVGTTLALLKKMAEKTGDKDALAQVAEIEKQKDTVLGGMKTIGPCSKCKETESCPAGEFEYRLSGWFKCSHGEFYCGDCVKQPRKDALEKRKKDREAKAKAKKK